MKDNFYIVTGAPGSGKTAIMQELNHLGYFTIDEPAREIIAEQRLIDGDGIYDRNPTLFKELMLSRCIHLYRTLSENRSPVFFDRGIPDMIAYSDCFNLKRGSEVKAAQHFQYNKIIFFAPSWREIYTNDQDRLISFENSTKFGDNLKTIYSELGYEIVEIPCVSAKIRAEFILHYLNI